MRPRWIAAVAAGVALLAAAQSPGGGREVFAKRCGGCHAMDRDKTGPRLDGLDGRRAGSLKSFEYSVALRKSGIVWTQESLDKWLSASEEMVPGSDMNYRVESAEERRQIIDYLRKLPAK